MSDLVISIIMLAVAVLAGGAYAQHRRGERKKAMLMAILALVMLGNIVIWLAPTSSGDSLGDAAATAGDAG